MLAQVLRDCVGVEVTVINMINKANDNETMDIRCFFLVKPDLAVFRRQVDS